MTKPKQITNHIMMIRPENFGFNTETAEDNVFQSKLSLPAQAIKNKAAQEFDMAVASLVEKGVEVTVIADQADPPKPDAIFPNNWMSTHEDGIIVTYPLYSETRRNERRFDIINELIDTGRYDTYATMAFFETKAKFLEGTGSLVLDRTHRIAYACRSERTDEKPFERFCGMLGYEGILFSALDPDGKPIYHTNVLMAVGETEVVLCTEVIRDKVEKDKIIKEIKSTSKTLVDISWDQLKSYAGNMLQVMNSGGEKFWVMSASAHKSLHEEQINLLTTGSQIIVIDIPTIEKVGGGSIRCMMAELF